MKRTVGMPFCGLAKSWVHNTLVAVSVFGAPSRKDGVSLLVGPCSTSVLGWGDFRFALRIVFDSAGEKLFNFTARNQDSPSIRDHLDVATIDAPVTPRRAFTV
jgi:hypothetical protein